MAGALLISTLGPALAVTIIVSPKYYLAKEISGMSNNNPIYLSK
ncbi:hypothetical protein VCRA2113O139_110138 [Vibrio crassostreae]|nr:hypothetical protein VCRA2113O139_110138 [Vibrio crassostreae]CAK3749042.1 hypothetical protein VCRA2121O155_90030 [Vibrio crassostreae]